MKDIILPVTAQMLCSKACEQFGIQIRAPQSDADSDSSNEAEFVVAVSINRQEDAGKEFTISKSLQKAVIFMNRKKSTISQNN